MDNKLEMLDKRLDESGFVDFWSFAWFNEGSKVYDFEKYGQSLIIKVLCEIEEENRICSEKIEAYVISLKDIDLEYDLITEYIEENY